MDLNIENVNHEVMARIMKAASHKYGCDIEIDFSGESRKINFIGNVAMKPHIAVEVMEMMGL
ncbi:MAG: hypothetical protein QX194_00790 [Methylococcales bacterium]|jgi:hypothetical protein